MHAASRRLKSFKKNSGNSKLRVDQNHGSKKKVVNRSLGIVVKQGRIHDAKHRQSLLLPPLHTRRRALFHRRCLGVGGRTRRDECHRAGKCGRANRHFWTGTFVTCGRQLAHRMNFISVRFECDRVNLFVFNFFKFMDWWISFFFILNTL